MSGFVHYYYVWDTSALTPVGPYRVNQELGGYSREISSPNLINATGLGSGFAISEELTARGGPSRSNIYLIPNTPTDNWPQIHGILAEQAFELGSSYGDSTNTNGLLEHNESFKFFNKNRAGSAIVHFRVGDDAHNYLPTSAQVSFNSNLFVDYHQGDSTDQWLRVGIGGGDQEVAITVTGAEESVFYISFEEPLCDINLDGHVDQTDLDLIESADTTQVGPNDFRDQNGNGVINGDLTTDGGGDPSKCKAACTEPACNTEFTSLVKPTATPEPTESPTPTQTGTPTLTPTITPTATPTITPTPTRTSTPTSTPTRTPTSTPTRTPTPTSVPSECGSTTVGEHSFSPAAGSDLKYNAKLYVNNSLASAATILGSTTALVPANAVEGHSLSTIALKIPQIGAPDIHVTIRSVTVHPNYDPSTHVHNLAVITFIENSSIVLDSVTVFPDSVDFSTNPLLIPELNSGTAVVSEDNSLVGIVTGRSEGEDSCQAATVTPIEMGWY